MTDEPTTVREVPRMTEDDIKELVLGLAQDRVFTATELPREDVRMLQMVFVPLAFTPLAELDWDNIGNIVEYLDKASERSINGYPIFMSCRIVHKDDWAVVVERAIKAREALAAAIEGSP